MGLFTSIDIAKSAVIVEYKGALVRWRDVRDEDGHNAYIFKINERWAVDARRALRTQGRYANDARGLGRALGHRNNAEYIVRGKKVFIAATRKIHAGSEIFVDYGRAFWRLQERLARESA